ncbi:MAG: hypothetical protein KGL39_09285 [Patescibacteria group bacterium]|nr:hypothetical protein [Patescibacteria group bacterium]
MEIPALLRVIAAYAFDVNERCALCRVFPWLTEVKTNSAYSVAVSAAKNNWIELLPELLSEVKAKAEANARNPKMAVSNVMNDVADVCSADTVLALIENGAWTVKFAFTVAVSRSNLSVMRLIAEHPKCHELHKGQLPGNAFSWAATMRQLPAMRFLFENTSVPDDEKTSASRVAATNGHREIIDWLEDVGALNLIVAACAACKAGREDLTEYIRIRRILAPIQLEAP